jgi:hypothetical protein
MLNNRDRYELRHQQKTLATGHLTGEKRLQIGDRNEIGGSFGIVREIQPLLGEHELRLLVERVTSQQS